MKRQNVQSQRWLQIAIIPLFLNKIKKLKKVSISTFKELSNGTKHSLLAQAVWKWHVIKELENAQTWQNTGYQLTQQRKWFFSKSATPIIFLTSESDSPHQKLRKTIETSLVLWKQCWRCQNGRVPQWSLGPLSPSTNVFLYCIYIAISIKSWSFSL